MDEYLKKLVSLYPKSKIYLITPKFTPRDTDLKEIRDNIDAYCTVIIGYAKKYNLQILHGEKLLPCIKTMFCSDYVHFSEAGAAVFANKLLKYMKK